MLIKTDHTDTVKHARITLMCELRPGYYITKDDNRVPNLTVIALDLKELEYGFISPSGEAIVTISTTMPVGYNGYNKNISPQWLVVDIAEAGKRHENLQDWEDFLAAATEKIMNIVALNSGDRIAAVEYDGNKRFVVMDDINNDF